MADVSADYELLIVIDDEGAVILRQSFVEPERRLFEGVVDEQVSVLVKDHLEGFVPHVLCHDDVRIIGAWYFGREGDVVHVRSSLKVAGDIWIWFEGRVRAVTLEDDNRRRHR